MRRNKVSQFLIVLLSIILLISLLAIGSDKNGKESMLKSITDSFLKPFYEYKIGKDNIEKSKVNGMNFSEIKDENLKLKEEIEKLKLENRTIDLYKAKIEELTNILGLKQTYSMFRSIGAKVILTKINKTENIAKINVGRKQGIRENMAVVYSGGLYGKIYKVNENTSEVQLVTDPISKISVKVGGMKESIILKGEIDQKLILTLIPLNLNILKDMDIYTSGEGGIIPAGIYVGKVLDVVVTQNKADTYANVKTLEDLSNVTEVLVLDERVEN